MTIGLTLSSLHLFSTEFQVRSLEAVSNLRYFKAIEKQFDAEGPCHLFFGILVDFIKITVKIAYDNTPIFNRIN